MAKTKKKAEPEEPKKTRRVQLWELIEGDHAGLCLYFPDLQVYDVKVQNAVLLYPYNSQTRKAINKPFLTRVGTRGYIKKEFYE